MPERTQVAITILHPSRDAGRPGLRTGPTRAVCRAAGIAPSRVEILHHAEDVELARVVAADLAATTPTVGVVLHQLDIVDRDDLAGLQRALTSFARTYKARPEAEEYLLHLSSGSRLEQIGLVLLAQAGYLPARLLHTSPPPRLRPDLPGRATITDLEPASETPPAPPDLPMPQDRFPELLRRLEDLVEGQAPSRPDLLPGFLTAAEIHNLDLFDRTQLESVLKVCVQSRTLTEAGKRLFAVSRTKRKSVNDADRVRKYLARHGITWDEIRER